MIRWLLSLFGIRTGKEEVAPKPATPSAAARRNAPSRVREEESPPATLSAPAKEFLIQLVSEAEPADLQALPADDRVFLSGILKRIRENQLTIPLLPQAAIEISRLMGNPNSHIDDFVRVLESDPALSVDVLRIANSAFYGFSGTTQSVHQAVVRIGLTQIRGLVIVAHLHGRVLQGGTFQTEAGQLSNLSMSLAQLGQELSAFLHLDRDAAFTRGVLSHVEHFVIMGTAAEVSTEHHRKIVPSAQGLLVAFRRFGPKVRELAAAAWGLADVMLDSEEQSPCPGAYAQLARGLVRQWTGEPLPVAVAGVDPERLEAALRRFGSPDTAHDAVR